RNSDHGQAKTDERLDRLRHDRVEHDHHSGQHEQNWGHRIPGGPNWSRRVRLTAPIGEDRERREGEPQPRHEDQPGEQLPAPAAATRVLFATPSTPSATKYPTFAKT